MATSRKRIRYTFDVHFATHEEKEAFLTRLKNVRQLLTPEGCPSLDNCSVFNALCDTFEGVSPESTPDTNTGASTKSFMQNSGMYTSDATPDEPYMFITEKHCFSDLVSGLATPCPCGMTRAPWTLESVVQRGHVLRASFCCRRCKQHKRMWSSSRVFGGHYLVNQKVVHSFTCAGVLPVQYTNMTKFCGLGSVGHNYIREVYQKRGYTDIVHRAAEQSMKAAVEEVQSLPEYSTKGEWVITDARHDSTTANAYHTTVPCLSGSTQKILGISTIAHSTAQTRELTCTQVVLPQVLSRGLNISEVSHDIQAQVSEYVSTDLGLVNSYDTWHGTKNVAKEMKKICQGKVRDRGKTWFPQLVDKQRSTMIHLYWSMRNCGDSASKLRELIENIPQHYKGIHSKCASSSSCHTPNYSPSKEKLTDKEAERKLLEHLKATYIYREAESFCRCRDTYWVECFNHQLLTYLPKRIHFSTTTFTMRMNLALMDWNENVNRKYTSMRKVKDLRRPDHRTAMKVLVKKTFRFVDMIWTTYIAENRVNLSEIQDGSDTDDEIEDGVLVPLDSCDESED